MTETQILGTNGNPIDVRIPLWANRRLTEEDRAVRAFPTIRFFRRRRGAFNINNQGDHGMFRRKLSAHRCIVPSWLPEVVVLLSPPIPPPRVLLPRSGHYRRLCCLRAFGKGFAASWPLPVQK